MVEKESYWTKWSPYWSYQEDFFLDLEAINKLSAFITNPVLIIGAGQGLLVEQLKKKNFTIDGIELDPQMISYAKTRRGLDLVHANAKNMPFDNDSYKTSIIATGVVDFLDDQEQIKLIINEALRVTNDSGKVFVAFYKYHPKVEALLKYTGMITDKSLLRFKKLAEMTILSFENPIEFIRAVQNETNVGFLNAFFVLMKSQLFLSKKEKRQSRKLSALWKQAKNELDNPQSLFDCLPGFLPYRSREQIRSLFKKLNFSIENMYFYDSCIIAQL
ncbi:MAG: class I SAM-dependent methyltransferase [Planctomycetota bacterium]|jgi:ubiquinone/menaquinone biosynthesis C-methylase UbiE